MAKEWALNLQYGSVLVDKGRAAVGDAPLRRTNCSNRTRLYVALKDCQLRKTGQFFSGIPN